MLTKQLYKEIIIFSVDEQAVIEKISKHLHTVDSSLQATLLQQKSDLEQLAHIVNRAPTLLQGLDFSDEIRNRQTLIKKLFNKELNQVINLPSKVVLGFGYTVSKLHFYGFLLKITVNNPDLKELQPDVEEKYADILFSIMAEELYKNILHTGPLETPLANLAADELIMLWENRFIISKKYFAPYIQDLWTARQKIVPVLGTLQGTIELMRLSFLLDPVWNRFLTNEGSNAKLGFAIEEFLFDLSFEEINLLKDYMKKHQISAIDRKNAEEILISLLELSQDEAECRRKKSDQPSAVRLYLSFLERRANSQYRKLKGRPGAVKTLEEHFFSFLNNEKIKQ